MNYRFSKLFFRTSPLCVLLALVFSGVIFTLHAHDPNATASEDAGDFVSKTSHGLTLTLKVVPGAALAAKDSSVTAENVRDRAAHYAAAHPRDENQSTRVGDLAFLVLTLQRGGQPVNGAEFELVFDHIEDQKEVFQTRSGPTSGEWIWGQQFFDGAEHLVHVRATPTGEFPRDDASADSHDTHANHSNLIETSLTVAVEGISPPGDSIFRSILLLLAVVALGMFVGYYFGLRL